MAELDNAVNELLKKKRVEENLKTYTEGLLTLYRRISTLRLSMNYYTLAQVVSDIDASLRQVLSPSIDRLQDTIKNVFLNDCVSDDELAKIEEFRNSLIERMELMTSYVDRLAVYEYILNRVEYRFKEPEFSMEYYHGDFEKDILNYITSDKDNTVINMKIGQIIGQLPMRLSKNKYFDILKDSLSLYKGSEKLSVRDFLYMVRTSGTLLIPNADTSDFKDLDDALDALKKVDFSDVDKETYEKLRDRLDIVSASVKDYSDSYVMITEIVNDLYSVILSLRADDGSKEGEYERLYKIINETYQAVEELREPDEVEFEFFEGIQEKLGSKLYRPESVLPEILMENKEEIDDFGYRSVFDTLDLLVKLQSASTFATLNDEAWLKEPADEKYIEEVTINLANEFSALFEGTDRYYKRAVMASVLSNLPAFFNNADELKGYIHIALTQCTDEAEKQCCMVLIKQLISMG